jgi:hypothetical protein
MITHDHSPRIQTATRHHLNVKPNDNNQLEPQTGA